LVRSLLRQLSAGPGSANMALATPAFKEEEANGFEKYYGVRFHKGQIPAVWGRRQEKATDLRSPPPLRFVPSALSVHNESAGVHPELVEVRPDGGKQASAGAPLDLWWQGRGAFPLPRAQLRLKLTLPQKPAGDAADEALRRLHAELARQVLEEATEDLQNCGMGFSVDPVGNGYRLSLDGYDQHLDVLLLEALGGLLAPSFGAAEFGRARQQLSDELSDTTRKAPYELALDEVSALTTDGIFSREEVLAQLGGIDEGQLRKYLESLQERGLRAQLLVVGNMEKAPALSLAARAADLVAGAAKNGGKGGSRRLLAAEEARRERVWAAARPVEVRMKNPIPGDHNHAIVNSYQYGVPDVSERVRLMLLGKMIENPVYDQLRTKQQLGYVVFGFVTEQVGVLELRVLVQGAKESPDRVDGYIESVIDKFGSDLANMTQASFVKWKASLQSALNRKDQNMGQEADRYWGQIVNDGHCFNRKELALQYLESLEKPQDVIQTFQKLRHGHKKVSVKMFGADTDPSKSSAAPLSLAAASSAPAAESVLVLGGSGSAEKQRLGAGGGSYFSTETICRISQ